MGRAHTGKEIRVDGNGEWGETGKREREQVEKNRAAQGHGVRTKQGDRGSAGEEEGNLLPTRSIPFAVRNLENRPGVFSLKPGL